MGEYLVIGRITFSGAMFVVEAADRTEARKKAEAGQFVDYALDGAEVIDVNLDPMTMRVNE